MSFSRKKHHLMKLAAIGIQILKSKVFRKRIPIVVSIHVTNKCNMRCTYCYANVGDRFDKNCEDFTTAELKRYITEMKALGTRWIIFLGGEPLLRPDIGELIDHVNNQGMLCELVTNGTLIDENIDKIKGVDLLCISIDGTEGSNDSVRGNGSYKRALQGLITATKAGIKTRIHAVFTRFNTNPEDLAHLASLATRYKTTFGFSNPITTGQDLSLQHKYMANKQELVAFLKQVIVSRSDGKPVYNSLAALEFARRISSGHMLSRSCTSQGHSHEKKRCFAGDRFCYIDSEGFVYPCIESGVKTGLNIRKVGFKQAFEYLANIGCDGCDHIQYFEANDILDLKFAGILLGIKILLCDLR
ncbi:MAG: radical SAM/SPASM domain-containing protein [Candidatus Sigynarchaeota archaeon]